MERKTKIHAEEGKQDLRITREFELPVELLFKAFAEPGIMEKWLGQKVLKLESKKHGSYRFETTDAKGNKIRFNGTIHDLVPEHKMIRTFEMENTPFGVQLEVYEFKALGENNSKLEMHVIYESVEQRDQVLKLPFSYGINMAHNRLQEIVSKLKR